MNENRVAALPTLTRALMISALFLLIIVGGCSTMVDGSLSSSELEAIKAASQAYGSAWLSNDADAVMATLTSDAVIVPSGMAPIRGQEAIRAFWFPVDSPPTTVTAFTSTQQEVGGQGDFGFVLGTFTLKFEYDGANYSNGGTYMSVFRRLSDGTWKISHRMWSDQPR